MNKVTLDGKPPKDRINLNEKVFTNYISKKPEEIRDVKSVIYHNKTDSFYFVAHSNNYKGIHKIILNANRFKAEKQNALPSTSYDIMLFIRKGDIYLKQECNIYVYNTKDKIFTEIAKNLPDTFYYAKVCIYDVLEDRLIVSTSNKIRSYSFEEKTVTEISNTFPSNDIVLAGAPIIKGNKLHFIGVGETFRDIASINLNTGIVTTFNNVLPFPINNLYGVGSAKAFLLNNEIYLIGLNDGMMESNYYLFKECEDIDKWERDSICTNQHGKLTHFVNKSNDSVLVFNFETLSDCYEIKKAYVKEK